jgi:hypothetical protein
VGSAPAQHAPEPLDKIKVGAVAGQAIPLQMRMGGEHLRNPGCLVPGGVIDRDDDGLAQRGRIRARNVAQVSGNRAVSEGPVRRLAAAGLSTSRVVSCPVTTFIAPKL